MNSQDNLLTPLVPNGGFGWFVVFAGFLGSGMAGDNHNIYKKTCFQTLM
jgi:hypothetical protein